MAVKVRIKGHEKFPLREGWLTKGLFAVKKRGTKLFNESDAADELGVGTNMVKSIRYWMQAFQLIEKNGNTEKLTDLAKIILEKDPYFENDSTLWILHSNIARNLSSATSWYMFFNLFNVDEFEKKDVVKFIHNEVQNYSGQTIPEGSVKDDVDVLLSMYSKYDEAHDDPEDKNQSPLSSLGLVKKAGDGYTKVQPDIRKLDEKIILYELSLLMKEKKELSIDSIVDGKCGIGKIYNLSRVASNQYLERLENKGYITINRTAGLDMVYSKNLPESIDVLNMI